MQTIPVVAWMGPIKPLKRWNSFIRARLSSLSTPSVAENGNGSLLGAGRGAGVTVWPNLRSHPLSMCVLRRSPSAISTTLDWEAALRSALASGHIGFHQFHFCPLRSTIPYNNNRLVIFSFPGNPLIKVNSRFQFALSVHAILLEEMELFPRISCWTARVALLVMVVVLLMHHDNQQNAASASPVALGGFEDYSEGGRPNISLL